MSYQKPPALDNLSTKSPFVPRTMMTIAAACIAIALLALGPAAFLILEDAGGIFWAFTVLAGFFVACAAYREWLPELGKCQYLRLCLGVLLLYLALPLLSYFVVDGSEFALKRVKRQLLFLGIPFIFLLLWWLRVRLRVVLIFIALNALAFGMYAFWFYELHSGRVYAVTHAVHFGNVSLFLAFASLALLFVAGRSVWLIVLASIGVIMGASASVLSGARGGWLGVPILVAIALISTVRAFRLKRSTVVVLAGLTILILAGLWQTKAVQTRVATTRHDFGQLSKNHWQNSMGLRITMWEQAWMEIREAPILGTGFSGYRTRVYAAVQSGTLPQVMLKFATEPHNEYLYQWMTRGIFSLIIFFMCFSLAVWYFFRLLLHGDAAQVAVGHVGLSLIAVVAVSGLTITVIDQRAVIRFLVWILAILMYCVWLCEKERAARFSLEGQ